MKKKLIFFSYNLCIGGIENALVTLLNKIDKNKYNITLILEEKKGEFLEKLDSNINVYEYKLSKSKFIPYRKIRNYIKRLIFTIKNKNKYDFSCCYATYSLMGSKLAKIASKNSCLYVHSDYSNLYNETDYVNFFKARRVDLFKHIIFVSNESRMNFLKHFNLLNDKCITINNFIDKDKILPLSNETINIDKTHDILFVFVGRLEEASKKILRLLNGIKELSSDFSVELWIIGDGPDRYMYEEYIKDNNLTNVYLLGMKKNPYPYMKKADYIIMTSEYEGFPVIYLEAILLNKKIITTIDVTDDYIDLKDNYGYIISKSSNMVEEVKQIIMNDDLDYKVLDFDKMNLNKLKKLEKIFDNEE